MEAGGGLDVGHVFARLDAKLDDSNFRRFDSAVDRSRAKTRDYAREQDKLKRSTEILSREQQRHVKFLRSQGHAWASVAEQVGVSEEALRSYNTTSRTTTREQEKVRRSTRDTQREFIGLDGGVARANRTMTFFSRTLRLLKWPALIAGAGAALQGVNALSAGVVALVSALAPLSGLLVVIPSALGTLGQSLGTAALGLAGVKDAVKSLSDEQVKSGGVAEDNARKQRAAAEQIRSAEEQLGDAERNVTDSQHELNEARRDAVTTLQDMRNAAIEARLGEQGAQLALRRAISDLRKAEADPESSLLDIEELELSVREARQQLKSARQENKQARAESRQATKGGVKKESGVVDARRALQEAERDRRRAQRGVQEAERDGRESLNETAATASKVQESFSKLSPEAARFSRFLFGLKPQLEGLQRTAAKGLLPGAERGIKSAMQNLPVVKRIIGATSGVLGTLSERAGKLFGSKGFGRDLEIVGKGNARTLGLMGRSAEHLTKGLTNIMVVAQPFLRWVGKYTDHLSAWIEKSTEVNRKNGDMAKFFGRTRQVVEVLTSIFQSLGATLGVIREEAAPLGRQILKAFDEGAEGLEKWSESTKGRNSIAQYFKDAKGPLWEAGRLVRDIVKAFFDLGDGEGMESIEHLLHQLRVELLPVFTEMTKETTASFGPHLIELLTNVLGLFGRLAGESGPLTLYVDTLSAAAKVTNTLLDAVPGLRGLVVNLLGLAAVMKTVHGLGKFTGITKGLEMIFGPEMGGRLKTKFAAMMKQVFVRGALAGNLVYTWGSEVAGQATAGISKQIGRFRAVARRAAIAFIGTFAPQVAAGMAAGGRLGEVLSARFPRLAGMFKNGGKMAGRAFIVGAVLGVALIGYYLGQEFAKAHPKTSMAMRAWGENAGQNFVNGLIDIVNLGVKGINEVLDRANVLGKLGVDAPQIGEIGHVKWNAASDKLEQLSRAEREAREPSAGDRSRKEAQERTPKRQRQRERRESRRRTEGLSIQEKRENYEGLWGEPPPPGPGPWPPPDQVRSRRRKRGQHGDDRGELSSFGLDDDDGNRRRRGGRKPEDEAKETKKRVTDEHKKMRRGVEDEASRMQRTVADRFGKIRKSGADETKRLDKAVTSSVQDMRGAHDRGTAAMLSTTDTRFGGMRDIVTQRSSKMQEDLSSNVGEMNATTTAGMEQIQAAVNKALKAFGVKGVDLGLKDTNKKKGAPAKAAGGGVFTVPGEGLQDNVYLPGVHAMVAPGEDLFVANRHQQPMLDYAVASTFGVGGLDDFFSTFNRPHYLARGGRAGRFAGGGMVEVPSDPNHATDPNDSVAASIVGAVDRWVRRYHANITAAYDPGGGHVSPGHNVTGTATDVEPAGGWSTSGTRLFEQGLRYLVGKGFEVLYDGRAGTIAYPNHGRGNHAHIEWVGNGTAEDAIAALGGMVGLQRIRAPEVTGRAGTERTLAQAALDIAATAGSRYVRRKTGMGREGAEHGVGVPTGPIKQMARRMVMQLWGAGEWPSFASLEEAEAGWNPYATNPTSGAYGLPQALPPSKLPAGAQPGSTLPKLQHAKLQLQWMMSYIQERYGSPSVAWSFHQANNWYARGGRALRHFAGGGGFKGNINHTYPSAVYPDNSWFGLTQLPGYVIASLAEAAGQHYGKPVPGRTMEKTQRGEGANRPGSRSTDGGWGLWAATEGFVGDIVGKLGGFREQLNPVKSAAMMAQVWNESMASSMSALTNAWHGATGNVSGLNEHYDGNYDISRALGGLSFGEALMGKAPKAGKPQPPKVGQAHDTSRKYGVPKKKKGPSTGLATSTYAGRPTGKYSPAALLQVVAETGIGLPFALLKDGKPNWQGLTVSQYTNLVDGYYRQVAEYRANLGEERKAAEESFPANNLLSSVTSLSPNTIAQALGFHMPAGAEAAAYGVGYSALGALDRAGEVLRGSYLNTFTEGYLAPYERRRSEVTYARDAVLASLDPEREQKEFARAKLKGLKKRLRKRRESAKRKPNETKKKKGATKVGKGKAAPKGKRAFAGGRLFARGGKSAVSGAKSPGRAAVSPGRSAPKPQTPKQQRRRVQQEIKKHNRQVNRRAANQSKRAEELYEEESEGVLDPAEREREEIEERYQYELARREELAPLLSEVAASVQKTALVGSMQRSLFGSTFFARGGMVGPAAIPAPPAPPAGNPRVTVPLSVRLAGAMEALNPHIEAVVDGKVHRLGHAAGASRATVSAPGRRVSYGGK